MAYYLFIIYMVLVNSCTFLLMGYDKQRAKRQRRRVPEKRLFLLSAIGGAGGTMLGMKVWRHKTKHRTFTVGMPFLLGLNLMIVIGCIWLAGVNANS
ncbi:DUF1294 domain-containing protein [Paenibacillus alkaliterrae]|uniref:DUF1294 domain-containing protein n=1 Tax=Paenibacillus alkaliterrae TaxID=320909 RepID=UPI001F41A7A0|nr:DUF1294 domain-containing protein [Paenibacillus alkaliterrae]MCF2937122.1 DUF1294 domain-containing protein [Paenibacillus alkaliterrae]